MRDNNNNNWESGGLATFTGTPTELDLIPEHIRAVWDARVYGNEAHIDEGYFELRHDDGNDTTPICGRDKFMLIKGLTGSRKSLFASCLLSSAFTTDVRRNLGFRYDLAEGECIQHFDTEMDVHEIKGRKVMFNGIMGLDPEDDRYQVFALRDYSYRQKAEMITHAIGNCEARTGFKPGIILIDQFAHLLPGINVNNTDDVTQALEWVLAWMRMTKAMIIIVLHTNRGGENSNGMMGVAVDNMCTASFLVDYDKETRISKATQHKGRKKQLYGIKFMQDDWGLPRLLNYEDIF